MLNDVSDYGPHYAKTLNAWSRNLNDQRAEIEKLGFD